MTTLCSDVLVLHPEDNVAVALKDLTAGQWLEQFALTVKGDIPAGHKIALARLQQEMPVMKYGQVIGHCAKPVEPGEHVHVEQLAVKQRKQRYRPSQAAVATELFPKNERKTFAGYRRNNGKVGTRNYMGVIATVSCSADVVQFVADAIDAQLLPDFPSVDGVVPITHGNGCCHAPGSEGLELLQRTLSGYARNPNFGGVLFIGLGCETNRVSSLLTKTDLVAGDVLQTLSIQEAGGTAATVEKGLAAALQMLPQINAQRRQSVSAEHLVVGLECGGSDGYSGITANPALGAAVDLIIRNGGTAILSETPEIYGAEHLLVKRAASASVGRKLLERIEWWEQYTALHNAQINNNPTPGNKAGGISTILEKSLGAVAKAGMTELTNVYEYAQLVEGPGLVFMDTPGYDVVSITGMIAGGANLVCFTTGRGTVAGFRPIPTIKLASNTAMFERLRGDMDVNCGNILDGETTIEQMGKAIFEQIVATASGKKTKSEVLGFGSSEFVPWQMGAVL